MKNVRVLNEKQHCNQYFSSS